MQEGYELRKYVYGGCRYTRGSNDPSSVLYRLEDLEEPMYFSEKSFLGSLVGGIYEMESTKEGSVIVPKSRVFVDTYGDNAKLSEWKTAHYAYVAKKAALAQEAKAKRLDPVLEALEPLRTAYNAANQTERIAIEIMAINYLRYGKASFKRQ